MNLTIINDDGAVYVDGYAIAGMDLSNTGIPDNVHALQWKSNLGWIEFKENPDLSKAANEVIEKLPAWAKACEAAHSAQAAKNQALADAASQNQPASNGTQDL